MQVLPKGVIEECDSCGSVMKFRYSAFERIPFHNMVNSWSVYIGCPVCHNNLISIFFYWLPIRWQRRLFKYWGYKKVRQNGEWVYQLPDKKPDNPEKSADRIAKVLGNTRRNAFVRCIGGHDIKLRFADVAELSYSDLDRFQCLWIKCDRCEWKAGISFFLLPWTWQKKLVRRWGGRMKVSPANWHDQVVTVTLPGKKPFEFFRRPYPDKPKPRIDEKK